MVTSTETRRREEEDGRMKTDGGRREVADEREVNRELERRDVLPAG